MFDDPGQNLKWLEEELLAAEEAETPEEEEEYAEDADTPDPDADWLEEVDALLAPEKPARRRKNPAVDYARTVYEDEEELDEDAAVFDDDPPPKGIGGLLFLAILEVLGILAVVGWWLKWLS